MSVRRIASSPPPAHRRTVTPAAVVVVVVAIAAAVALLATRGGEDVPRTAAPALDRASAVAAATAAIVDGGRAGSVGDRQLRLVQQRSYATTVDPDLRTLTLRAAKQQRRALLRGAPRGASLLERTVPFGTQVVRADADDISVAVWTVTVAGPDRGRRVPNCWWLTTRVDLVPEGGRWRVRRAVAIQGPTPRLVRVQQAGVGAPGELRGMLRTTRGVDHGA